MQQSNCINGCEECIIQTNLEQHCVQVIHFMLAVFVNSTQVTSWSAQIIKVGVECVYQGV